MNLTKFRNQVLKSYLYATPFPFLNQEQKVSSTSDLQDTALKQEKQKVKDSTAAIISSGTIDKEDGLKHLNNKDGFRVWDKIHYCFLVWFFFFCQKGFNNITKHYLGVYSKEISKTY